MADNDTSIWMYSPSFALAVIGCVIYCILFLAITYLTLIKYRAWYFTVVVIGAAVEVAGYVCRVYSVKHQADLPPFVMTLSFTVLAPVFVAAGNYLLISRLIPLVLPRTCHTIFGIPGRLLTPIFVTADVFAFLIQGSGSGIANSNNWTGPNEEIGRWVLVGGLAFQFVCFGAFLCIFVRFHHLAKLFALQEAPVGWRKVVLAVYISSAAIMVRCVYRVCEFAEGMDGYAFRTEWLFWVWETIPMIIAIGVFCWHHPSRLLGNSLVQVKEAKHRGGRKSKKGEKIEAISTPKEQV